MEVWFGIFVVVIYIVLVYWNIVSDREIEKVKKALNETKQADSCKNCEEWKMKYTDLLADIQRLSGGFKDELKVQNQKTVVQ